MANERGGLGRGLAALFGSNAGNLPGAPKDSVKEISVAAIRPNPYQPRREFDEDALNELAESVKSYGILQPIILRKVDAKNFEIIAGERRLRAAKIAGLQTVPSIVREYTDAQMSEISIIENVQRRDLNAIEEARAYERLIKEFGHTQEVIAAKIGRSRSHIANLMRLLKLAEPVRDLMSAGKISPGQARPLLAIEDENLQAQAAQMIIEEDLSARGVEIFIRELRNSGVIPPEKSAKKSEPKKNSGRKKISESEKNFVPEEKIVPEKKSAPKNSQPEPERPAYFREAENRLHEILGATVKIFSGETKNQIQIIFSDESELMRIIKTFGADAIKNSAAPERTREEKISALRNFSTKGSV